ncbi:IPT/TIG domain-containing protein [Catenuloplanes japonicus]|uniref:IPT/TIG domain-containing protein n=1 Tax=Catenuloplanes japonicus TaxID=33876 RepID=UPI000524051B|nr:IPT/TIG domain-containing protein [Catenuloplanes japonicus]
MRKSQPTTGRRLLRAGIATGAVAAVLLAAAPPALAASTAVTLSPPTGPTTGTNVITASGPGLLTGISTPATTTEARFVASTTCPATAGTVTATNIKATSVAAGTSPTDDLDITVPVLAAVPTTYKVCIYGSGSGATTTSSPLIGSNASATVTYRTHYAPVLAPTTGPAGGGNTVTLTSTALIGTGTTVGSVLNPTVCAGTYTTTGANIVATTVKTSADVATITIPATAAAPSTYKVCLYNGTTVGTSLLIGVGDALYTPKYPQITLSAMTGKNAGGNSITGTATGLFTGSPAIVFSAAPTCPSTYGTPDSDLIATFTKTADVATITVPTGVLVPNVYNVCAYVSNASSSSAIIGASGDTYTPSVPTLTLNPDSGSTATATTITVNSTQNFLLGVTTPGATLSKAACPSKYTTTGSNFAATGPVRISNTKAAITVPTTVVHDTVASTTSYNVCVYNGSAGSSTLVGTSTYRVGAALAVSTISPTGGPAQGGSEVTITGTGFTPGLTASIAGSPITNIVVASSTTFTGTTTPHASGIGLSLTVTTEAGTKTKTSAFDYTFGITVTPNTAPSGTTSVTLDVLGAGFSSIGFANPTVVGNNADAHVYLVRGGTGSATAYNPLETGAGNGIKTIPQIQECGSVLVISDLELLCTLNLNDSVTNATPPVAGQGAVPEGTYTITVVASGISAASVPAAAISRSLITSGSTFTVAPY